MRIKPKTALIGVLLTAVIVIVLSWPAAPIPAQAVEPSPDNLLENWCFCDGSAYQDQIQQLNIPNGWYLAYLDNEPFSGSDGLAYRPEVLPVDYYTVSRQDQQELFYVDGVSHRYALKAFKGNAPTYFTLWQEIDLQPGQRYRLRAWVYPDFVQSYQDEKTFSPDPWAGEVALGTNTQYEWFAPGHDNLTYGQYNELVYEFVAEGEDNAVGVSVKGKWGLASNGAWLWGVELTEQDAPSVTPTPEYTPPTATPTPEFTPPTATPIPGGWVDIELRTVDGQLQMRFVGE